MVHAITSLDGRYSNKVGDLVNVVSEFALMRYRVKVMLSWMAKLTDLDLMQYRMTEPIDKIFKIFGDEEYQIIKKIESTTNHDVKAVEYYLRECLDERLWPYIHILCTSEDVNNVAYALMLKDVGEIFSDEMEAIMLALEVRTYAWKSVPMLSRTHGQAATPTTMGKEIAVFHRRLKCLLDRFNSVPITAKFNGASGNYAAHVVTYPNENWLEISKSFIEGFGLTWNPLTTQIESHDMQATLLNELAQLCTTMIDLCNDLWLYISNDYFSQKVVTNETGSSTMPHKVNPIDLENARGQLKLARGLARTLADELPVSTWQRDLSDSTMQRSLGEVFGHFLVGLKSVQKGLGKLELRPEILLNDLNNNPEVLTEAIQSVLRANGHADAYEQLKALSRGQKISLDDIYVFVKTLDLPKAEKDRLLALTPATYIGLSERLAAAL